MKTFFGVTLSVVLFLLGLLFNFKFTDKFLDPYQSLESVDFFGAVIGFIMCMSAGALFTYVLIV